MTVPVRTGDGLEACTYCGLVFTLSLGLANAALHEATCERRRDFVHVDANLEPRV
jgi:hypothetical protein